MTLRDDRSSQPLVRPRGAHPAASAVAASLRNTLARVKVLVGRPGAQSRRLRRVGDEFGGRTPRPILDTMMRRRPIRARAKLPMDPVALAVLAIERLGPASIRAAWVGKPVTIAVPDDETAVVFRKALAETAKLRPSDRLIEVVVERGNG